MPFATALLSGCLDTPPVSTKVMDQMVKEGGVGELPVPTGKKLRLTSQVLVDGPVIGIPYRIHVVKNALVVSDQARGPMFHIFGQESGELWRSLGRAGRGPGDFESAMSVFESREDPSSTFIFDGNLSRVTEVATDSLKTIGIFVKRTFVVDGRPSSVIPIGNSRFLTTNSDRSTVLNIFDAAVGKNILDIPVPFLVAARDSSFLQQAFVSKACSASNEKVAVVFLKTARLAIVDVTSGIAKLADTPYSFDPTFIDNPLIRTRMYKGGARGVRNAYVDCTSNERSIFALFSGRLIGKFRKEVDNAGRIIHEFDWTGKFIQTIELDHDAFGIALYGNRLFTITEAELPQVRVQILPMDNTGIQPLE